MCWHHFFINAVFVAFTPQDRTGDHSKLILEAIIVLYVGRNILVGEHPMLLGYYISVTANY
jgi:hypothetical protein